MQKYYLGNTVILPIKEKFASKRGPRIFLLENEIRSVGTEMNGKATGPHLPLYPSSFMPM